ncbi:MAG: insulinase family protein [Acidobacteriota bacterium]|nr:insulinase family protein [Acidobacteriota bacterium]MDQ2977941.1 insulinase family protein [Acidobacteriota bacterium]
MTRRRSFEEQIHQRRLSNGGDLLVLENHFNPTVAISGSLHGGPLYAPADRRVIASMTAEELLKGTQSRSKLQIAEDLESRGASLSFSSDSSDPVGTDIAGAALSRDVDLLLDRLAEILRSPSFPEEELEKEKKRLVGAIRQQQDQTSARAQDAAARRIYPPGHPFHRRTGEERIARVESLTRADLEAFYAARYGAGTLRLVVVGDVDADRLLGGLERRLSDWTRGPEPAIPQVPVPPPAPVAETIEMPDKANADVILAEPAALTRTDPSYLACALANSALGQSSLTSRLGVRVRDTEGLTYGIHSSFHATHVPGPFVVSVTVKPASRDAAVASTLDEISRFVEKGMTEKELADEKSSRIGKFMVDMASNAGIAQAIDTALYYGLGLSYLDDFGHRVNAVKKDEADAAFARMVRPDAFTIVSAGTFSRS